MARTLQQQIDDNDAAIAAIESGAQSYTTADGRTVTRASLQTLYDSKTRLEGRLASATPGKVRVKLRFGGGS